MVSTVPTPRRVVISGLGLIGPLGFTPEAMWQALEQGRSGVAPLERHTPNQMVCFGGEAREFRGDIDAFGPLESDKKKAIRKGLKTLCREAMMGLAAGQRALTSAGLTAGRFEPERVGVVYGADYMLTEPDEFAAAAHTCSREEQFEFERWNPEGFAKLFPLWLLKYLPNMPAAHLGIYNDLRGPSNSITYREAAANLAVGEAARVVARGHADAMVAGACGTRLHPIKCLHVSQQSSLVPLDVDPLRAARPFDAARAGMVVGEGAAAVVLESLDSAQGRGATIHGEIVGIGSSTVFDRDLRPRPDRAIAQALAAALREAGLTPAELGHVQAHGLSTRGDDRDEAQGIIKALGDRGSEIPVAALKSFTGNLGAGSGMHELIAGLLALKQERLFTTLNYETPDAECPLNVVRDGATPAGKSFANVSVTPQGQASCVIVQRWESY